MVNFPTKSVIPMLNLVTNLSYFKSIKYVKSMILYAKTYLKMHSTAQNDVNALRLRVQILRIRYANFTQLLTLDDTVQGQ